MDTNDLQFIHLLFGFLPFLILQGLKEFKHPYQFVAQQGFKELLTVDNAGDKASAVLPKIIVPLRAALVRNTNTLSRATIMQLIISRP